MTLELVLVPFELRPDAPPGGLSAEAEGLRHSERVEAHLIAAAREEGREMVLPDLVPNTHLAMALAEYARDLGEDMHRRAHDAIFDAYYVGGRDIGSREVLLDVASDLGLEPADVTEAWDSGRYDQRIHEYAHLAMHLGIDSTPAALICNELLIGSRPYGVLREAVQRCLLTPEKVEEEMGAAEADA